jgi:hypothetical protein
MGAVKSGSSGKSTSTIVIVPVSQGGVTSNVGRGSTTVVEDLRRVRRVGSSGSAGCVTGAGVKLDPSRLIVESDGPLGAHVKPLFGNSGPVPYRTPISRMFGCLAPTDRVRAVASGTGGVIERQRQEEIE